MNVNKGDESWGICIESERGSYEWRDLSSLNPRLFSHFPSISPI